MATTGTTTVDFGSWPGSTEASVAVTGQGSILSGSLVEAWLFPADTADHSVGEHLIAPIKVTAHTVSAGVGFTITAEMTEFQPEPVLDERAEQTWMETGTSITTKQAGPGTVLDEGGWTPMMYGVWNVAWVWA